jgi:FkbM family methyltransferase
MKSEISNYPEIARDAAMPISSVESSTSAVRKLGEQFSLFKRRLRGRHLRGSFQLAPYPSLTKVGTEYGGWIIPESVLDEHSVCICVGAGEDISFDIGLIREFGCSVLTLDPTPRAVKHIEDLREATRRGEKMQINRRPGEYYEVTEKELELLEFKRFGLWDTNESVKFYSPKDPDHVSHSALNLQHTDDYFEADCLTLGSILERSGLGSPTLLKIDIEGAEYRVLDSLEREGIHPRVLCVEYDEGHQALDGEFSKRIKDSVAKVIRRGYALVHINGWDFTFVDSRAGEQAGH